MKIIVAFVLGIAIGVYGYRSYIEAILGRFPYTRCDYCKFLAEKEGGNA